VAGTTDRRGIREGDRLEDVKLARQFFRWGMKRGMVEHNPFADVKAGTETNPARLHFVDRDTIARVMDAAPSIQWRLLIALSRYAGLRVPSEAFRLRWADVDWDRWSAVRAVAEDGAPRRRSGSACADLPRVAGAPARRL
jgi:integrase